MKFKCAQSNVKCPNKGEGDGGIYRRDSFLFAIRKCNKPNEAGGSAANSPVSSIASHTGGCCPWSSSRINSNLLMIPGTFSQTKTQQPEHK